MRRSSTSASTSKFACTASTSSLSSRLSIRRSSLAAVSSSTGTRTLGRWTTSAFWIWIPASSSAPRPEGAVALGEQVADVGAGAVAVVGHRLDEQRDAAGAVALVHDVLQG